MIEEIKVLDLQNIEDNHNFGVLAPEAENAHPGAASFQPTEICPSSDWRKFWSDFDKQIGVYFDDDGCVPSSIVHGIEAQINAWAAAGLMPEETVAWMKQRGILDAQTEKAEISERWLANVDGTGRNGTSQSQAWIAITTIGLIAEYLLTFPTEQRNPVFTWDDFYDKTKLTPEMYAFAKEFEEHFDFVTKTLKTDDGQPMDLVELKDAAKVAPFNLFIAWAGPDMNNPETQPIRVQSPKPISPGHSIAGAFPEPGVGMHIIDQYPPFLKLLSPDFYVFWIFQTILVPRKVYNMSKGTPGFQKEGDQTLYVQVGGAYIACADWNAFLSVGGTTDSVIILTADQFAKLNVVSHELFKTE